MLNYIKTYVENVEKAIVKNREIGNDYLMNKVRILHLTSFVGKRSFGIGYGTLNLLRGQQSLAQKVTVWSCDSEVEARQLEMQNQLHPNTIRTFPILGPSRLAYSPSMGLAITKQINEYDIIHQNGLWTAISRLTNRWRSQTGKPTVIAPHGSLDCHALRRSIWKKRLALFLYERENLRKATCLHALSPREAEGFRAFGLCNPIAIIPAGISEEWLQSRGNASAFRQRIMLPEETRILLFLGRITPIKNLPMLIRSMANLKSILVNWKLIIAGVNEFGHQKELEKLIKKLSLQSYVKFTGPLYGSEKRDAFAAADLFVLPSYTENFAQVVAEALGAGVPVLTTKGCPWEEIVTESCGWWVEISEESIGQALQEAIQKPRAELCEMGARGKKLIAEKYTIKRFAEQTIDLYNWLLGRGPKPDFVVE